MHRSSRVREILSATLFALGISCIGGGAWAQIDLDPPSAKKAAGAPIRVVGVRDLTFGTVIPGLEARVEHSDPTSGLWEVKVGNDATLDINFLTLPPAMNSTGDSMPVRFESAQAMVVIPQLGASYAFDPASGITVQVGQPGRAYVYLGGVASPRGDQSPGDYASPVTIDVSYTNAAASPPM